MPWGCGIGPGDAAFLTFSSSMSVEPKSPEGMAIDRGGSAQPPASPGKSEMSTQAPSNFDALFAELRERPHNPDEWRHLVELAEQTGEVEKIRTVFDVLLKQYPNTVRGITLGEIWGC